MNAVSAIERTVDMIIIGAGISGIGMAVHMKRDCPDKSFAILDRRQQIGGTWDLFRYPGVRSDSDMFTLGFSFEPWTDDEAIASGDAILAYLGRITDKYELRPHMQLGQTVISAEWDSTRALWTVTSTAADGTRQRLLGRFLFLGSGYYDYDNPYDAGFDTRPFKGQVVHPQFWPNGLDVSGKRVVVIGSGATAVTLVPALVKVGAQHVTMLQRTPTWYITRPAKDRLAIRLRKILPVKLAYALTRAKNVFLSSLFFKRSRTDPESVKQYLLGLLKRELGPDFDRTAFTPPYNPWDQRICLVPDSDLFQAIKAGSAEVVTDHIDRFDPAGIALASGRHLDADVIVTATGLRMLFGGNIAISVDGKPIDISRHYFYRNCLFSNVPNLAGMFGYVNASWTLRVDLIGPYLTRLLRQMDAFGAVAVTPVMMPGEEPEQDEIFHFSSGYVQRAKHLMPRNAATLPWRLNQDYQFDRRDMRQAPLDDGILHFTRAHELVGSPR